MLVALETATDSGSVALGDGTDLAGEVVIGMRTRHAEALLPAVDFLLRTARLARRDLTGVVVGAGPGSFTGVRVAAATARGLAQGLGVPLFAYSSLAALAAAVPQDGPLCALFDARRGEVYAACYERRGDALHTLIEPLVLTVPELLERVRGLDVAFLGEGARRYAAELGIRPPPPALPRASALLQLAAADRAAGLESGRIDRVAGWEPAYLRASGAERGIAG